MSQPKRRRNWAQDQDYLKKLSAEELAWLDKFNREYYKGELGKEAIHPVYYKQDCEKRRYRMFVDAMRGAIHTDVDVLQDTQDKKVEE